jgi:hypothetical protein
MTLFELQKRQTAWEDNKWPTVKNFKAGCRGLYEDNNPDIHPWKLSVKMVGKQTDIQPVTSETQDYSFTAKIVCM